MNTFLKTSIKSFRPGTKPLLVIEEEGSFGGNHARPGEAKMLCPHCKGRKYTFVQLVHPVQVRCAKCSGIGFVRT